MIRILMVTSGLMGLALLAVSLGWQRTAGELSALRSESATAAQQFVEFQQQVDAIYDEIDASPQFNAMPDGLSLKADLLETTADYYRAFLRGQPDDLAAQPAVGKAHLRLGKIAYLRRNWALALEHLEAAKELLVAQAEHQRTDIPAQQQMALNFHLLSQAQWSLGELQAALHSSDRAMETQQRLMSHLSMVNAQGAEGTASSAPVETSMFARMFIQRSRIHCSMGDRKSASEEVQHAGEWFARRPASTSTSQPDEDLDIRIAKLEAQCELANACQKAGELESSDRLVEQMVLEAKELQGSFSSDLRVAEVFVDIVLQAAILDCQQARHAVAIDKLALGRGEAERMCALYPSCQRYATLAESYRNCSTLCESQLQEPSNAAN